MAYDWINANMAGREVRKPSPPKIDHNVSRILGFTVTVNDPRLTKLVMKWKSQDRRPDDVDRNYLRDEEKVKELKEEIKYPSGY